MDKRVVKPMRFETSNPKIHYEFRSSVVNPEVLLTAYKYYVFQGVMAAVTLVLSCIIPTRITLLAIRLSIYCITIIMLSVKVCKESIRHTSDLL